MSQADTQTPGSANVDTPGTSPVPNLGKNLFWDDVRIGLNVLSVGVIILLAGALAGPWLFPAWVVALVVLVGGLATMLGLKICAAIPPESGVSLPALGAFGTGVLCLVTVIAWYFMGPGQFELLAAALVLGSIAHVLLAVTLYGCVKYLGHKWLTTLTQVYILVAIVFSLALTVYLLSPLAAVVTLQVFLQVVTLLVGVLLLYLVSGASTALTRAQQGLPVEGPSVTTVETEESAEAARERASLAFKPVPPPEEFEFTRNDVDGFQAQDSTAGKAIVALMTGVFSVGVILYTIIALMAAF